MPRRLLLLVAVAAGTLAGCSSSKSTSTVSPSAPIAVTSAAFADGKLIPATFTCLAANVSPPLAWTPQPTGTAEWAIVMEDIDASFVHWVVSNLPSSTRSLNSNELPKGAVASQAGNGASGYVGPCPPSGKVHHYRITVYALSHHPHLNANSPTKTSLAAIQQAAISKGTLSGQVAR